MSVNGVSAGGSDIVAAGNFDSPRMNDGNPPPQYQWGYRFNYDRSLFRDVARISIHFSC